MRNRLLCQYAANATGRQVIAGPAEATAMGNVIIQAVTSGQLESLAAARRLVAASCDPVVYLPRETKAWAARYEKTRELWEGPDGPARDRSAGPPEGREASIPISRREPRRYGTANAAPKCHPEELCPATKDLVVYCGTQLSVPRFFGASARRLRMAGSANTERPQNDSGTPSRSPRGRRHPMPRGEKLFRFLSDLD
ncbi:MAG: FGGY-family carbohydrate kinase [Planctomycetota bacterium]